MKLIIGLGNPGDKFKKNRHNVGHMFVESQKSKVKNQNYNSKLKILQTSCFMNDSGRFVAEKVNFFKVKPGDLYIVHDDLDLPIGKYKIQLGVGPKVHNGVASVERALGMGEFWRIRIGVDNRPTSPKALRAKGEKYVLEDFTKEELEILEGVFYAIVKDDSFPG